MGMKMHSLNAIFPLVVFACALTCALTTAFARSSAASVPGLERWRNDISLTDSTQTQAVEIDTAGYSYVAGVSSNSVSYFRFVQKIDRFGNEIWRYESPSNSVYAGIVHQQIVVDETDDAIYVLRSNLDNATTHLISVAKHDANDGSILWNESGGFAMGPSPMKKSAAMGLDADGTLWVVRQGQSIFVFGETNWTIQYRSFDANTGILQDEDILVGSSSSSRYLYDAAVAGDRLFVAYREQDETSVDLVSTAFELNNGLLNIINPHEPTPCSAAEPCRTELNFIIPESTTGTATFTDAALDTDGNFVVTGYFERFEPDDCLPECFGNMYWYHPVIVKLNRSNQVVFQTVETEEGIGVYDTPTDASVHVALQNNNILTLISGENMGGVIVAFDPNGTRTGSRHVDTYVHEIFSAGGCSSWIPVWQPAAITSGVTGVAITGQLPAQCVYGGYFPMEETARTVMFQRSDHPFFTADFIQGVTGGSEICDDWNAFRSELTGEFVSVSLSGSADGNGVTCSDPVLATQICNALNTGQALINLSCEGNTWNVGECAGTSISVNASVCSCASENAHIARPCIFNQNWGGMGTRTCNAPDQSLEVRCMRGSENLYEQSFLQNVPPASSQCNEWTDFREDIGVAQTRFVRLSGSADPTGVRCNDPVAASQICDALHNGATLNNVSCDGNSWYVGECGGTSIGVNSPVCNCASGNAHIARPCISNRNWGGMTTATCNPPSQTLKVSCGIGPNSFNDYFPAGNADTEACTSWNDFRASLSGDYSKITLRGSENPEGVSCNGPTADVLCKALHNSSTVRNLSCGGNTWSVGNCGGTAISVNTSVCSCSSGDIHIVRPCISNPNWGGMGTATCGSPGQSIEVICD